MVMNFESQEDNILVLIRVLSLCDITVSNHVFITPAIPNLIAPFNLEIDNVYLNESTLELSRCLII